MKSAFPITSNSTVPEEDEAVMRPMSFVINDTLPEADLVSAATTFPPIFAFTEPEEDSALNITPALREATTLPEVVFNIVSPTTSILLSVMLPDDDFTFSESAETAEMLTGDEAVVTSMFFISKEEGIRTSKSFLKRIGSIHTPLEAKLTVSVPSSLFALIFVLELRLVTLFSLTIIWFPSQGLRDTSPDFQSIFIFSIPLLNNSSFMM